MANSLLTPTAVTREALRVLHQKLNFIGSITRDYDDSFAQKGAKIGDTLKIRLPNEYTVRSGAVMNAQPTQENTADLKINAQKGVDLEFSDAELALDMDDFSERIIDPAMARLAANIEADALSMYKDVFQQVDNQGTAATFTKVLLGRKKLVDALAPTNDREVVLNTQDNVDMVDALKGLFNSQMTIAKQNREGYLGRTAGFDFTENTLLPMHTRGAANTAYTTDTRTSAMATDGTVYSAITVASGANAMNRGDVFTIANVYRVHPETKLSTAILHQFVAAADYVGGAGSVSISPSIILGGGRQNCIIPSTSATAGLTFSATASSTYGISLAFQKGAFCFATADLPVPRGMDMAAREVFDGVSMRFVRGFDIVNGVFLSRLDVLYGYKTLRPGLAVRLANN